jgi:hypothetical protein
MKIILLLLLVTLTVLVIPTVYAESYDEWKSNRDGGNASFSTHQEHFEALSSWATNNKDILGKDVSFHVENRGTMKADFTVSNVYQIPLEKEFHYILSFDTNVKLKSEVRYPTEFVMDGRLLTVMDDKTHEALGGYVHEECHVTGIEFNSESGNSGTFHSCFGMISHDEVGNKGAGEIEGVSIYVHSYDTGSQPISVLTDIENIKDKTISAQSWFDGILNFFKSLFV